MLVRAFEYTQKQATDQDIHKIVDVFNKQLELPKYNRIIPVSEIEGKDFNLNIPRYIDSQEEEDIQDIDAHLNGGIPNRDIEDLGEYWEVYPGLKKALFAPDNRKGYSKLKADKSTLKSKIFDHPEFTAYTLESLMYLRMEEKDGPISEGVRQGVHPKQVVVRYQRSAERFSNLQLIDKYDVYSTDVLLE
jgi:type I restriction enzyme M protein